MKTGDKESIRYAKEQVKNLDEEAASFQRNKDIAEKSLHFHQSKLMEFKAFEAYGESFPQFVLQLTILIKSGLNTIGNDAFKIFSILTSFLTIILTVSGLIVGLPFYINGKRKIQQKTLNLQYAFVLPMTVFIVTPRLLILCLFFSMFDTDSAGICITILSGFVSMYFFLYWVMLKLQFRIHHRDNDKTSSLTMKSQKRSCFSPFGKKVFDKEEKEKGFFIYGAVSSLLVPVNVHDPTWKLYMHTNTLTALMYGLLCFISWIIVSFSDQYHREFDSTMNVEAYQIAFGVLFGTLIIAWFASYYILKKIKKENFPNLFLWAYENNDKESFEAMFDKQFDHNVTNIEGKGVFHLALDREDFLTLDKILSSKRRNAFDPNLTDIEGKSVLMYACQRGHSELVTKMLVLKNIKVNQQDNAYKTALAWASVSNQPVIVSMLLETNIRMAIDLNLKDVDGMTALSHAVKRQFVEVACLLSNQKNIEIQDNEKSKIFLWTYERNHHETFQSLFDDDSFDHNVKDKDGCGLLLLAYKRKDNKTLDRILKSKSGRFDMNIQDKLGASVLMYACEDGQLEIVQKIATINFSPKSFNQKNHEGKTPILIAIEKRQNAKKRMDQKSYQQYHDIVAYLSDRKSFQRSMLPTEKSTSLLLAYERENNEKFENLLNAGSFEHNLNQKWEAREILYLAVHLKDYKTIHQILISGYLESSFLNQTYGERNGTPIGTPIATFLVEGIFQKIAIKTTLWDGRKIVQGFRTTSFDGTTKACGMVADDVSHDVEEFEVPEGQHIQSVILRSGWLIDCMGVVTNAGLRFQAGGSGGEERQVNRENEKTILAGIRGNLIDVDGAPCIIQVQFKFCDYE